MSNASFAHSTVPRRIHVLLEIPIEYMQKNQFGMVGLSSIDGESQALSIIPD